ncbi:FAD-dependent oxidoreductase [Nocardioides caldifontis]|uniref:FAD-dependent oxidoreductase n=1 Tax=Nocardioides caldifontis TaxID=2588938 RepID=UPI0011DF8B85|nr:FAD-dependent oxidoreductase [Nocardioides caldifontis]
MTSAGEKVTFTFEGRTLTARRGQSVASALMQSGTTVLTRSFKYRRPRGYTCGYDVCGSCPVTVDGLPGVSACSTPVQGGESVDRERGWPSADRDVMRVSDLMAPLLPAGFQFRLFRSHPRLAHLAEKVMARVAGAGRFPTAEAAAATRTLTSTARPDVLVVGGGLSGCAAALGAASTGASVALVHRGPLGGRALARSGSAAWEGTTTPVAALAARLADEVRAHEAIDVLDGTALSWFETGVVPVVGGDRVVDMWPTQLVVATGSYDVPGLFPGNDKPGVVLADGVSKMLRVDGVVPWRRAVVLTDCERGDVLAAQLREAGVEVVAVVHQDGADGTLPGPRHLTGRIEAARGLKTLRAVDVRVGGRVETFDTDLLCVALRERPADDLALQWRYVSAGSPTSVAGGWSGAPVDEDGLAVVGSAAGWLEDDPEQARAVGEAVGARAAGVAR